VRIALAHDWLVGYRGGEAVLDAIVRAVHPITRDLHLFTMFDDGRSLTPAVDALPRTTSVLQRVPGGPDKLRRWLLPGYPAAIASLNAALQREHRVRPFTLLVSTSSVAVKSLRGPLVSGAQARTRVPHLCYCHCPARYLWSRTDEYALGDNGALRSLGLRACGPALRAWDRATARHASRFLANSTHTRLQIKRCYGLDADVLYPPVRTDLFTPAPHVHREDYWLFVGALEPYKRADLAIQAATQAGKRLVIAGTGSQEASLRTIAGPNVEFLGRVTDEQLLHLYRTARLLLFPQIEDFGIVAVEAQAAGLPVVARVGSDPDAPGGAADTVICGVTGATFTEPTPEALIEAAQRCPAHADASCQANAERFGERHFELALRREVETMLEHGVGAAVA
jgi:glycosyltransferase involved in cell wall biosynthesis